MGDKSDIEWTDATWNPTRGCDKISPGCKHCYAETFAERWRGVPGNAYEQGFDPRFVPSQLEKPLRWTKPRRIFVNSMSDLFHEAFTFDQIAAVFGVMAAAPQHTFQVLTKRPERMVEFFAWVDKRGEQGKTLFPEDEQSWRIGQMLAVTLRKLGGPDGQRPGTRANGWQDFDPRRQPWPLPNVWLGVSAENQKYADERIPLLLQCPAAIRFVSAEPLLGPINFVGVPAPNARGGIDWIIVGGESGNNARECHVDWIRSIVRQCKAAGIPCFVKQLGATIRVSDDEQIGATETGWTAYARASVSDDNLIRLTARKAGDMDEWPHDLRVRQYPKVA